jgi:hypothetical protein
LLYKHECLIVSLSPYFYCHLVTAVLPRISLYKSECLIDCDNAAAVAAASASVSSAATVGGDTYGKSGDASHGKYVVRVIL